MKQMAVILVVLALLVAAFAVTPVSAGRIPSFDCAGINDHFEIIDPSLDFRFNLMMLAGETLIIQTVEFPQPEFVPLGTDQIILELNDNPVGTSSFPGMIQYTASSTGLFQFHVYSDGFESFGAALFSCITGGSGPSAGAPCANVYDGRINNSPSLDCAAPIAVYINHDINTLDIYAVDPDGGQGQIILRIPLSEFEGELPSANELIDNANNTFTNWPVWVYWLADSNEIMVSTFYQDGKRYIIVWPVDDPTQLHHDAV
jgi:hypothetical protein